MDQYYCLLYIRNIFDPWQRLHPKLLVDRAIQKRTVSEKLIVDTVFHHSCYRSFRSLFHHRAIKDIRYRKAHNEAHKSLYPQNNIPSKKSNKQDSGVYLRRVNPRDKRQFAEQVGVFACRGGSTGIWTNIHMRQNGILHKGECRFCTIKILFLYHLSSRK